MEINLPLKIEMREKGRITLCDSDNRMILYNVNVCDFDRAKELCEVISELPPTLKGRGFERSSYLIR